MVKTVLSLNLGNLLLGGFLGGRVNPQPATMRWVPGATLVQLDARHQVGGPRLVHGQAESLVGHLLELSVLKAKPADVRDLLVRAGRNWFRQHRIDQLETENLVWFAILRKNSIHLNKVEKILLIQKLSQYAMLMLYYIMDPQPRISTMFRIY